MARVVFQEFNEGTEEFRVGCDRPIGRLSGKEVGFDKDAAGERKAGQVEPFIDKGLDLFRAVGVNRSRY